MANALIDVVIRPELVTVSRQCGGNMDRIGHLQIVSCPNSRDGLEHRRRHLDALDGKQKLSDANFVLEARGANGPNKALR